MDRVGGLTLLFLLCFDVEVDVESELELDGLDRLVPNEEEEEEDPASGCRACNARKVVKGLRSRGLGIFASRLVPRVSWLVS